jgi:tetratricopeptide (TPR) repeat protein
MVLFAVERFGMGRNVSALRAWGEGLPSSKVLPGAFGITESTFDNEFRAWASKRLARFDGQFVPEADPRSIQELEDAFVREGKKSAALLAQVAWKHLAEGRADAAKQSLDRARALNPKDSTTRFVAARFARAKGDADAEERELRGLVRDGNDGYVVQMTLAELSRGRKDAAALRTALAAAHRFDPTQDEPLRGLVDLARSEGRRDEEFALLRALAPLSEHDARIAHALGNALAERADWRGAYDVGESLLYQDVLSPETHLLLGRAAVATGRLDVADYEAESARLCMEAAATAAPGAKPPGPLDARLAGLRAHVAHARGATSDARRWAKEAKAADPKFTDLPPGVP